jgi:hypothetical protein
LEDPLPYKPADFAIPDIGGKMKKLVPLLFCLAAPAVIPIHADVIGSRGIANAELCYPFVCDYPTQDEQVYVSRESLAVSQIRFGTQAEALSDAERVASAVSGGAGASGTASGQAAYAFPAFEKLQPGFLAGSTSASEANGSMSSGFSSASDSFGTPDTAASVSSAPSPDIPVAAPEPALLYVVGSLLGLVLLARVARRNRTFEN